MKRSSSPHDGRKEASYAHLRYVSDRQPSIHRRRKGKSFQYIRADHSVVRDAKTLRRIASLAIPPAWKDVWICADPRGHLQATGRDARGRKQYRYHSAYRARRDRAKFHRLLSFGQHLPQIRRRAHRDLRRKDFSREKVLAAIVLLLEETLMRIGNEEYVRENHSFGLTTLKNRHVAIHGSSLIFHFRGKRGKVHTIGIADKMLAKIVHQCQELPGQHLFEYCDAEGRCHPLESNDVNAYLQTIAGEDFTAKEYRTWMGTVFAVEHLAAQRTPKSQKYALKSIRETICLVAEKLGNTPAVCSAYYIHPAILEMFQSGRLPRLRPRMHGATHDLSAAEQLVLTMLKGAN